MIAAYLQKFSTFVQVSVANQFSSIQLNRLYSVRSQRAKLVSRMVCDERFYADRPAALLSLVIPGWEILFIVHDVPKMKFDFLTS